MAASSLVFSINGRKYALSNEEVDPTWTLNDFIRTSTPFKGTKLGCGEGGCGACAVDISRVDSATGRVVHASTNSCLRSLASMDGFAVVTTDGLGNSRDGFHPIQERIADFGGSQCGYCTPGMVMTLYSSLKQKPEMTMQEIEERYDGNICRCTGYRPIVSAAKSFAIDSDVVDDICGTKTGTHDGTSDPEFPEFLKDHSFSTSLSFSKRGVQWLRPANLAQALSALKSYPAGTVMPVVGNTGAGIYKHEVPRMYVDIQHLPELLGVQKDDETGLTVGAAVPIQEFLKALQDTLSTALDKDKVITFAALIRHTKKVANVHVRGTGSIGGNLMLAKTKGFLSDLATILLAAEASVTLVSESGSSLVTLDEFLASPTLASGILLQSVTVPWTRKGVFFNTYKTALRPQNSHAWVNAGFCFQVDDDSKQVTRAIIAYGGIMEEDNAGTRPIRAPKTEEFLKGKALNRETLQSGMEVLSAEIAPAEGLLRRDFRKKLVTGFFFKFFVEAAAATGTSVHGNHLSATVDLTQRPVSKATHTYDTLSEDSKKKLGYVGKPFPKKDSRIQAAGEAVFVGDMKVHEGTLYGALVQSTVARGKIESIDASEALAQEGVVDLVTAEDVKGVNNVETGFFMVPPNPEPIYAPGEVFSTGQPIGMILATTRKVAIEAARLVKITYNTEGMKPVITVKEAKEAFEAGDESLKLMISDTDKLGDATANLEKSEGGRLQGVVECGSQKHFYMETQSSYAVPDEDGTMTVYSCSQWADAVQHGVSKVIGVEQHNIRVVCRRCGGAFGGKAINSVWISSMTAVAAHKLNRPVMLFLDRNTDMRLIGGREETYTTYDAAFTDDGRITALHTDTTFASGWYLDFSMGALMSLCRSLNQGYQFDHLRNVGTLLKTNTPGRTAVRGPGEIESSFIMEQIVEHVAHATGLSPQRVREKNLYDPSRGEDKMVCSKGVPLSEGFTLDKIWEKIKSKASYDSLVSEVDSFNASNRWKKQGVAMIPVKYGVTVQPMSGIVNVYGDGSVVVIHAGAEMGQGLNVKVLQVAAMELSSVLGRADLVPMSKVRIAENDSRTVPNAMGTGGSTGSEGTAQAVKNACTELGKRMKVVLDGIIAKRKEAAEAAAKEGGEEPPEADKPVSWEELCGTCKAQFVNLSAQAMSGAPSKYQNWGAGLSVVEVDVITGETSILRTDIVYDCGRSLNPSIDIGQIEGAYMMGIGALLREQVLFNQDNTLLTEGTWEYKPPLASDLPLEFNVELLQNEFPKGVLSSKASGEPPLILSVAAAMAIRYALRSSRKDAGLNDFFTLPMPLTPDVIQEYSGVDASVLASTEVEAS